MKNDPAFCMDWYV